METNRLRNPALARPNPLTVVIDTSFLLTMLEQHREFDEELQQAITVPVKIATIDSVVFELQRLARRGPFKTAGLAKLGLSLLYKKRISIIEVPMGLPDVDSTILAFALAEKNSVAVATVDRHLRFLLGRNGIPTVFPRGGRGLMFQRVRPRAA